MNSIGFPKMFGTTTSSNVNTNDYQSTKNNLKLLLGSEKNTLLGDPYYGVKIKYYMFDQNSKVLKDIIIDEIYSQIKTFIPQVIVNRNDIDVIQDEKAKLTARIRGTMVKDFSQVDFNLVIFKED